MVELLFHLEQDEDDWPPAAVERLWCEPLDGFFRVETCPLFVKGLSVGDVIEVQRDQQDEVTQFTLTQSSGNSTVWVIFWDKAQLEPTLELLRSLGCETTGPLDGWKTQLCSVNVVATIAIRDVDAVLEPLEQSQRIAVAYPSYRHSDS